MIIQTNILFNGYKEAYKRFKNARLQKDPDKIFLPLFETLNWFVTIDSKLRDADPNWISAQPQQEGLIRGVRYARNRVHHQWADIIFVTMGMAIPAELPAAFYEWTWKPLSTLPLEDSSHQDRIGKNAYTKNLENKAVRFALEDLNNLFNMIIH